MVFLERLRLRSDKVLIRRDLGLFSSLFFTFFFRKDRGGVGRLARRRLLLLWTDVEGERERLEMEAPKLFLSRERFLAFPFAKRRFVLDVGVRFVFRWESGDAERELRRR